MLLGGLTAVGTGWQWYINRPQGMEFVSINGLPSWRQAAINGVGLSRGSAANAIFAGIGEAAPKPLPPADLCAALYPTPTPQMAVTVFSDANCPNCRQLEAKLYARRDKLSLHLLDLPLLGPSSVEAAKAFVAAELQAPEGAYRSTVMLLPPGRLIRPLLLRAAEDAGLDVARFAADMDGAEVAQRLTLNARMAETLGIWGTPALTIGNTLVMGNIRAEALDALIAEEATRAATC